MNRLPNEVLGPALKQARENAGLTQDELADALGLKDGDYLSKVERGEKGLGVPRLLRAAKILKVPHDTFLVAEGAREVAELAGDGTQNDLKAIDAARRLTDALAISWTKGQFSSLDLFISTLRGIAAGFAPAGQAHVDSWIQRNFPRANADSEDGQPADSSRSGSRPERET